jgi:hypothetical protein
LSRDNDGRSKLTKKYLKWVSLSLFIHAIIFFLLTKHKFKLPPKKRSTSKPISSYLYKPTSRVESADLSVNKQSTKAKTVSSPIPVGTKVSPEKHNIEGNQSQKNIQKIKKLKKVPAPQKIEIDSKPSISAVEMLNKLKSRIASSGLKRSRELYNRKKLKDKNKIEKSIASSRKQPEIKLHEVDCNSDFNDAIVKISVYMGGTMTCQKPPDIDKFIDARLNKMGVKNSSQK